MYTGDWTWLGKQGVILEKHRHYIGSVGYGKSRGAIGRLDLYVHHAKSCSGGGAGTRKVSWLAVWRMKYDMSLSDLVLVLNRIAPRASEGGNDEFKTATTEKIRPKQRQHFVSRVREQASNRRVLLNDTLAGGLSLDLHLDLSLLAKCVTLLDTRAFVPLE